MIRRIFFSLSKVLSTSFVNEEDSSQESFTVLDFPTQTGLVGTH